MNNFELPQGDKREAVRRVFAELGHVDALMDQEARRGTRKAMAASTLYALAKTGGDVGTDEPRTARSAYRRMLAQSALYALPEAMAASSGAPAVRHGEGCRIRVEQSRAEPSQFFVVVELTRGVAPGSPTSLIICDSDDRCRRFPLPVVRDGIAQLIAESDSDLMRLFGDPTTRIYLQ